MRVGTKLRLPLYASNGANTKYPLIQRRAYVWLNAAKVGLQTPLTHCLEHQASSFAGSESAGFVDLATVTCDNLTVNRTPARGCYFESNERMDIWRAGKLHDSDTYLF